jgi:hypothetical protein
MHIFWCATKSATSPSGSRSMTSDHRVAGSSPAGCRPSSVANLELIHITFKIDGKFIVIGLLSDFDTIFDHVRINPDGLALA